ncbi:MAG TPA: glycosyltransferase family 1 protein [Gammaproteobacteria bacterium]|nr:glycosyltransferase family 1 protein [Gammaproteobacteria bacterium]
MDHKHPRRLRVALVSETWPPEINGVAATVSRFARDLRCRGHAVSVVRPRPEQYAPGEPDDTLTPGLGIPFYPGLRLGLASPAALARRWRERRPDVVYVATQGPLGAAALGAAARLAIPVVAGFHTNFHDYSRHYGFGWLAPAASAWLRRFHRRAWCTVAPTPALAEALGRQGFGRVQVIGRGVDTALFSPARRSTAMRRAWGVTGDRLVVLHVGRLAPEKNLGLALEAWRNIRQLRPGARFVVVGDGPLLGSLRQREPGILFAGARRGRDLAACYASADMFLFPSRHETFGNVTIEALASGLGVVAFDRAAASLYIRHRVSGMVVPPDQSAEFVAAAANLARDPGLLHRIRGNAPAAVGGLDHGFVVDHLEQVLDQAARQADRKHDQARHVVLAR